MKRRERGVTLIELLIAITLVSLLATGMLFAMRVGLNAMGSTNRRIEQNRRTLGAQRILEQKFGGFMPARAMCGQPSEGPRPLTMFFQGEPGIMRFVSAYSMQDSWRGMPTITELVAMPSDLGGVRLLMNQYPYHGPAGAGFFCMPPMPGPEGGPPLPAYRQPAIGPGTFVLADRLEGVRFSYEMALPGAPPIWLPAWRRMDLWPSAVRIEMVALERDETRVQPMPLTMRLRVDKPPDELYVY